MIIKDQGQKLLAATYRCQNCKVIIQLIEIYSPTKRNAAHCPYCGKGVLEPRNVIFC
jgi:DNA-directed RNA polymerase subunit RPC12/RpoP